jgi:hypothetical protein
VNTSYATIAGGGQNGVYGLYGTVGGGADNVASAQYSTVPGGYLNEASGTYSFAAGRRAKALHSGSFVWADSSGADFASTANNQFLVRAQLTGINTTAPQATLHINTGIADRGSLYLESSAVGGKSLIRMATIGHYSDIVFETYPDTESIGFNLPDGTYLSVWRGQAGINGAFHCEILFENSDRNRKQDVESIDPADALNRVLSLPITTWAFTNSTGTRHLGPMAQDFHAAFGLGRDNTTINARDVASVGLAAVQGLNQKLETSGQRTEVRIQRLETENEELRQRLEQLERLFNAMRPVGR